MLAGPTSTGAHLGISLRYFFFLMPRSLEPSICFSTFFWRIYVNYETVILQNEFQLIVRLIKF